MRLRKSCDCLRNIDNYQPPIISLPFPAEIAVKGVLDEKQKLLDQLEGTGTKEDDFDYNCDEDDYDSDYSEGFMYEEDESE